MPPTHTRPPQLLVATHNHGAGLDLLALAEWRGYTVRRAHTGAQALEQAHAAPPDLIALDESLTDMDALAPVTVDGQNGDAVNLLGRVLRATGRRSDAIGRVGPGEFAVIAPGTDRAGAVLLAERLARAVTTAAGGGSTSAPGLRAGYDA